MSSTSSTLDRSDRQSGARSGGIVWSRVWGSLSVYVPLIVLAIIFLIPFYLIVRNSLMTTAEVTSYNWIFFTSNPQWSNFATFFRDTTVPVLHGLRNSAIIAIVNFIFQMLFASMAGYALARIPFRGRNIIFFIMIGAMMIPGEVTFVPTYVLVAALGGINTLWGIIVPGLFSVFSMFLFRQFYLQFPKEIEEAGRVDGLGYFGIYRYLLMPNSIGILMALGVLALINSWNAFLWPLVVGQSPDSWTIQIVLSLLLNAQNINIPELFAGAAVGILPTVVAFLVMQRYIVEGVKLSGVRG